MGVAVPRANSKIDDLNDVYNEGNNDKADEDNNDDEVGDEVEVVDSDECDTNDEGKEKQKEISNKHRRIAANTELKCRCGCKRMYKYRELSECRGKECHRLIRAVCVPSTLNALAVF